MEAHKRILSSVLLSSLLFSSYGGNLQKVHAHLAFSDPEPVLGESVIGLSDENMAASLGESSVKVKCGNCGKYFRTNSSKDNVCKKCEGSPAYKILEVADEFGIEDWSLWDDIRYDKKYGNTGDEIGAFRVIDRHEFLNRGIKLNDIEPLKIYYPEFFSWDNDGATENKKLTDRCPIIIRCHRKFGNSNEYVFRINYFIDSDPEYLTSYGAWAPCDDATDMTTVDEHMQLDKEDIESLKTVKEFLVKMSGYSSWEEMLELAEPTRSEEYNGHYVKKVIIGCNSGYGHSIAYVIKIDDEDNVRIFKIPLVAHPDSSYSPWYAYCDPETNDFGWFNTYECRQNIYSETDKWNSDISEITKGISKFVKEINENLEDTFGSGEEISKYVNDWKEKLAGNIKDITPIIDVKPVNVLTNSEYIKARENGEAVRSVEGQCSKAVKGLNRIKGELNRILKTLKKCSPKPENKKNVPEEMSKFSQYIEPLTDYIDQIDEMVKHMSNIDIVKKQKNSHFTFPRSHKYSFKNFKIFRFS